MKLFFSKGSCSLVVRIAINEMGLKAEYEAVDLKTKKTASGKDFFSINPKGSVPVLELDNGSILTENAVILQYLADSSDAKKLLPELGNFKRYRVLEWLNYTATEMHKSFGPLFSPAIPQSLKDEIFLPIIRKKLDFLNKHLETHHYLMGEQFTLPDIYLFVILRWTGHFKLNLKDWSHVSKYYGELEQRPSIDKSLTDEG